MNTTLSYNGLVDIFINIKNKTFKISSHNAGTPILWESICRFLSGQYRGECDIPKYLDLRDSDNNSILVNVIPLTGRTLISNSNDIYTRCDCSILYSSLISGIVAEEGVNYKLVLCADPDPNSSVNIYRDLASVLVSSLSLSRITIGTSAAIEWRLYIQNGSE